MKYALLEDPTRMFGQIDAGSPEEAEHIFKKIVARCLRWNAPFYSAISARLVSNKSFTVIEVGSSSPSYD